MKKTVLVTGASSGIGKSFAEEYAKKGFDVVLVARSEDKLMAISKELENKYNIETYIILADLSKEYEAKKIHSIVKEKKLSIDILVNNAGYASNGILTHVELPKHHEQIMVNSVAVVDMCYLFIEEMVRNNAGTIINVASTSAFHPIPYMSIYAATKAFVLSFTEALSIEYKNKGIKIIAICPGATDTNFFANGGVSFGSKRTPKDVVNTTFKGINRGRISIIDGTNNIFTSIVLPKILSRKNMVKMVGNIMSKRID